MTGRLVAASDHRREHWLNRQGTIGNGIANLTKNRSCRRNRARLEPLVARECKRACAIRMRG